MTRTFALSLFVCAAAGCFRPQNSLKGQCSRDADCAAGSVCDTGQSPAICVVPQGACFPACAAGFTCVSGSCIPAACVPPCGSAQSCDLQTASCKDVTAASVVVTSPSPGAYAGKSFSVGATARAPGGVNGVTFGVRNPTTGAVLASAGGVSATAGAAEFSATLVLSGLPEGAANLVAVASYPVAQKQESAALPITIDLTPPVIALSGFDGRSLWFGPAQNVATVTAMITDSASGVDPAQVKLAVPLPDSSVRSYSGAPAGGAGLFTFSVPIADLGVPDGATRTIAFRIEAKDNVGNAGSLSGAPAQVLQVDRTPPSVSISADPTWYARGAGMLTVTATITDADSGVATAGQGAPVLKVGTATVVGVQQSATSWQFPLDPALAAASSEAAFAFTIEAQDKVGNLRVALGSRNIDDKPPAFSASVFLASAVDPGTAGVTYPPPLPAGVWSTGRDGSHFIYSDAVHIKGVITDSGAGLSAASLQLRIDGLDPSALGVAQAINSCTEGGKSCTFDIPSVNLNDLTKIGRFDAGSGNLTLVLLGEDKAVTASGAAAHNVAPPARTPIGVTRLWWSRQFSTTPASTVSGIAIHPSGDVIVSTSTAATAVDTLFALRRDGPFNIAGPQRWGVGKGMFGASGDLGSIPGAPAVGSDANGANVYVVVPGTQQAFVALKPDGSLLWSSLGLGPFSGTPGVGPASQINAVSNCEGIFAVADTVLWAACRSSPTSTVGTPTSVDLGESTTGSPVAIATGRYYVGAVKHVAQSSLSGAGRLTAATLWPTPPAAGVGPFTGVVPGPAAVFAGSIGDAKVFALTPGLASSAWSTNVGASPLGQAVLAPSSGDLRLSTSDGRLHGIAAASGTDAVLATLGSAGTTPLLATDNRIHIARNGALEVLSDPGYSSVWKLALPAGVSAAPNMDCSGVIYVAAADTVYAIVTDMVSVPNSGGLRAGSAWPKFQRDSRNSGNADAPTMWGVRTAAGCTQ